MISTTVKHAAALALLAIGAAAYGHGTDAGDVYIGHPYATPSLPGVDSGSAYIATLENNGAKPDRLLRASSPAAARVEMHDMNVDAGGVMRMREVDAIVIEPKHPIKMRPGAGLHLMLVNLKQPLKEGDTFPMTLEFERGGKVEVKVVVQVPKHRDEAHSH